MASDTKIRITDHAVLRYLERVKGMDIAAVRREMTLDVRTMQALKGCKNARVNRNDCTQVIVDRKVVTVVGK